MRGNDKDTPINNNNKKIVNTKESSGRRALWKHLGGHLVQSREAEKFPGASRSKAKI